MAAKVGPVSARFTGRMALSDVPPPAGYTLAFDGQGGAAGFASGEARVTLAPTAGGAATDLSYAVEGAGRRQARADRLAAGRRRRRQARRRLLRAVRRRGRAAGGRGRTRVAGAGEIPARPDGSPWVRYAAIALMLIILGYLYSRGAR